MESIERMRNNLRDIKINLIEYANQINTIQNIFESAKALIFIKDNANRIMWVNDYFCEILNLKKEDIEGKNITELMSDNVQAGKYSGNDIDVFKSGISKTGILEPLFDTDIYLRTDKHPVFEDGKVKWILGYSVVLGEGHNKYKPNDREKELRT